MIFKCPYPFSEPHLVPVWSNLLNNGDSWEIVSVLLFSERCWWNQSRSGFLVGFTGNNKTPNTFTSNILLLLLFLFFIIWLLFARRSNPGPRQKWVLSAIFQGCGVGPSKWGESALLPWQRGWQQQGAGMSKLSAVGFIRPLVTSSHRQIWLATFASWHHCAKSMITDWLGSLQDGEATKQNGTIAVAESGNSSYTLILFSPKHT